MATVLVVEPHPEVRELLLRVVRRLGHDAVAGDERALPAAEGIDLVLAEPAHEAGLDAVAPLVGPGVALVCVSIYPPSERVRALRPAAYLQKPFALAELEAALAGALAPAEAVTGF